MSGGPLNRVLYRSRDLLFLPWLDGLWRRRLHGQVVCLLYHRVAERRQDEPLAGCGVPPISPAELHQELSFLQRQGGQFLSFRELREGCWPDPDRFGVIVSFDDGFACNYDAGLEVLESLGLRGIIFQSTAMLCGEPLIWEHILYWIWRQPDLLAALRQRLEALPNWSELRSLGPAALLAALRDRTPWQQLEPLLATMWPLLGGEDRLRELAAPLYPSERQLQQAVARGHEIGSHGHQHLPRHNLSAAHFEQDLIQSRRVLSRILSAPPAAYSYPFNSHQPGDAEICGHHFSQVATVDGGTIKPDTSPLALPRITWPGPHRNRLRRRRWLWTGRF
ncbi:MAG: polysaccharide deacetylase family protein [Synechococcaceae cyanobacterium]|nr:polysaccharide deacetylase family protein [Synechococcaceae cyanobacterium]